ncbi:MAG TPA: hypothetical protein VFN14_03640 [Candidatus Limnocylindria bacterium]|nr:hypothetical protein [Candidatus Limnocylindria bacterium]
MQDNRRGGGQRRDFNDRGDRGDQRGGQRRDFGGARRGQGREYPDRSDFGSGARDFPRERPYRSDRPYGGDRRGTTRTGGRPPARSGSDEGGMAIRLDPRRLSLLKELAGEQGMRPGELVTEWIQERLDAERAGGAAATGALATGARSTGAQGSGAQASAVAALSARVDDLSQRLDELMSSGRRSGSPAASVKRPEAVKTAPSTADSAATQPRATRTRKAASATGADRSAPAAATTAATDPPDVTAAAPRGRRAVTPRTPAATGRRVPLHEEIASVISEGGPMSAAQIAQAIVDRGRYAPPRSDRPLDAATVNSRVSNPIYRSRFRREDGKIGLSE